MRDVKLSMFSLQLFGVPAQGRNQTNVKIKQVYIQ